MNHDPVKLLIKQDFKQLSIFANAIYTDVYVSLDDVSWFRIIESDNVSKCVVVEVFTIDFQQVRVWAENVVQAAYRSILTTSNLD